MKKHLELLHRAIKLCDHISELKDEIAYDLEVGKKDNAKYRQQSVYFKERKLKEIYIELLKLTK